MIVSVGLVLVGAVLLVLAQAGDGLALVVGAVVACVLALAALGGAVVVQRHDGATGHGRAAVGSP